MRLIHAKTMVLPQPFGTFQLAVLLSGSPCFGQRVKHSLLDPPKPFPKRLDRSSIPQSVDVFLARQSILASLVIVVIGLF